MNQPLTPSEIEYRKDFINEVNVMLDGLSKIFDVEIPKCNLQDYTLIRSGNAELGIVEIIANHIFKTVDEKLFSSLRVRGGALSASYYLVCCHFQKDIEFLPSCKIDVINFNPFLVIYLLAELLQNEFMRYRLWNDDAISALEDFLFSYEYGYFRNNYTSDVIDYDDFLEWLESVVREEHINEGGVKIVTASSLSKRGIMIYFAEYVPVVCLGQEKLLQYFNWRNSIAKLVD